MYKERVVWSQEEEDLIVEAMKNDGRRVDINMLKMKNEDLNSKTNKCISNKIASLKNKPTKYKPRVKWTKTEEETLYGIVIESNSTNSKISYSSILEEFFPNKSITCLKNKAYSIRKTLL